jgi:hypothetical protein
MSNQQFKPSNDDVKYRFVRGYDCGNGKIKTPAYFTAAQMREINEHAAFSGKSFTTALADLVSLGLQNQDKTASDRRRMALLLGWPDSAEIWNIAALDHLLWVESVFGAEKLDAHVSAIKSKVIPI